MAKVGERAAAMAKFLRELGVQESSFGTAFANDSDWTLIIKLHAYVEASLNFALVKHFKDPRLEEAISQLEVSDRKRGKLAFVKALDLLPSEHRGFIQRLSEIRNMLAHGVRNVDFDLSAYWKGLDPKKMKEMRASMIPLIHEHFDAHMPDPQVQNIFKNEPRFAIFICVAAVMNRVHEREADKEKLQTLVQQILSGALPGSSGSNPKAA